MSQASLTTKQPTMNDAPSPTDSINSLDRRDFVRKSAFATGALTFAGLISAGHAGPPSTTTNTTVVTTSSVLTVVGRTNQFWGTYTVTSYRLNPTPEQLLMEIWEILYGGGGTDYPVKYEPGPESNYASVSQLERLKIDSGTPNVTPTGPNTYVVTLTNVTITIDKRIKALIS
jgi:hypothetical protein